MQPSTEPVVPNEPPLPDAAGPAAWSLAEALAAPALVFGEPGAVLAHPGFDAEEKRIVLLSWARDALALEELAETGLPEARTASRAEAAIEALALFDPAAAAEMRAALAALRPKRRAA